MSISMMLRKATVRLARGITLGSLGAYYGEKLHGEYVQSKIHKYDDCKPLGNNVYALSDFSFNSLSLSESDNDKKRRSFESRIKLMASAFRDMQCKDPLYFYQGLNASVGSARQPGTKNRIAVISLPSVDNDKDCDLYATGGHEAVHHIKMHKKKFCFTAGFILGVSPLLGGFLWISDGINIINQLLEAEADILAAVTLGTGKLDASKRREELGIDENCKIELNKCTFDPRHTHPDTQLRIKYLEYIASHQAFFNSAKKQDKHEKQTPSTKP